MIAAIAFPFGCLVLGRLFAILLQRTTDVVRFIKPAAFVATHESLIGPGINSFPFAAFHEVLHLNSSKWSA